MDVMSKKEKKPCNEIGMSKCESAKAHMLHSFM